MRGGIFASPHNYLYAVNANHNKSIITHTLLFGNTLLDDDETERNHYQRKCLKGNSINCLYNHSLTASFNFLKLLYTHIDFFCNSKHLLAFVSYVKTYLLLQLFYFLQVHLLLSQRKISLKFFWDLCCLVTESFVWMSKGYEIYFGCWYLYWEYINKKSLE